MFANRTVSDYNGEGGTNYAFIGAGASVKAFSFGVNIGYMFGNIRNTSRLLNIDSTSMLGTDYSNYTRYGSFYWKAGLQYHDTLQSGLHLRLGATMALSQNLKGERESYGSSIYMVGSTEYQDTAYHTSGEKGDIILPAAYSFGAQLSSGKWSVAADATLTDWSSYSNYGVTDTVNEIKDNTLRINAGGEYTPDPFSVYSYMSRVTYRAGFFYGTDYVRLHNTDMNYYGLTLGASFPFKRSLDRIHAAFEMGRRGTTENGLVQSNFYKFHLGISLNDKWFIKRRYD